LDICLSLDMKNDEIPVNDDAFHIWDLTQELVEEYRELEGKQNRSAGKRARAILLQISEMCIPMRKDILSKMKAIPIKPRKK
jgi:hypothetical protein